MIGEDLHDALTGHSGRGIGRDYGKSPLAALREAMGKLRHVGFELGWVWQPSREAWDHKPRVAKRKRCKAGKPRA